MAAALNLIDPITQTRFTLPIMRLPCCGQSLGGESIAHLGKWLVERYENPCPFCREAVSELTCNRALEDAVESAARSTGVLPVLDGGAAAEEFAHIHSQAAAGNALAQFTLGMMYAEGRGVEQNDGQAVGWYLKAAEQGHAAAQGPLGFMYAEGRGVAKDDGQAAVWYRKAAEQGDAIAQSMLGCMYIEGRGVAKDKGQALYWLRKVADQGKAPA